MIDPSDVKGIVLFSGIGGSSLGLHQAGVTDTVSVEWDEKIAEAANANGIRTVCADIRELDPYDFAIKHFPKMQYTMVQASPPCTSFSAAGKQKGRNDLPVLAATLRRIGRYGPQLISAAGMREYFRGLIASKCNAETSALSLEPIFWIASLLPDFISFEQVPAVLPLWEIYAEVLEAWGYNVWVGNLSSEAYSVPQTRKRAYLLASRHGEVGEPPATHSRYYPRDPERLDEGVLPWVSMAEALSGGLTVRPSYTVTGGGTATGGAEPFGNGARQQIKKAVERGEWAA